MAEYRLRIYEIEQEKLSPLASLPECAIAAFNELIDGSIIPIGAALINSRQEGRHLFLKVMHDSFDAVPEGAMIPTERIQRKT